MKVKELIEILQTLDPESTIWREYDGTAYIPAVIPAKEHDHFPAAEVKEGDYAIIGICDYDIYMYHDQEEREYLHHDRCLAVEQVEKYCKDYPYKGEKLND